MHSLYIIFVMYCSVASHYMFNLGDFGNVVKGIKLIPNTHLRDLNNLIRGNHYN